MGTFHTNSPSEYTLDPMQGANCFETTGRSARLEQFGIPPTHPICVTRDVARTFYDSLDQFVLGNFNRPTRGFGFSVKDLPDLEMHDFVENSCAMLEALTEVIKVTAIDDLVFTAQEHAKELKQSLQRLLIGIGSESRGAAVSEGSIPQLLEFAIVLQRQVSDHMTSLATLSYGISIKREAVEEQ